MKTIRTRKGYIAHPESPADRLLLGLNGAMPANQYWYSMRDPNRLIQAINSVGKAALAASETIGRFFAEADKGEEWKKMS